MTRRAAGIWLLLMGLWLDGKTKAGMGGMRRKPHLGQGRFAE